LELFDESRPRWTGKDGAFPYDLVKFQAIGVNCELEKREGEVRSGHSIVARYTHCAKKVIVRCKKHTFNIDTCHFMKPS
jgi:hypothetical protein